MRKLNRLLIYQALQSISSGALTTLLPLLMADRGIPVEAIGLIYSLAPLIFQGGRMIMGTTSDFVGRRPFLITSGLLSGVTTTVYYLSASPGGFALGRMAGALCAAANWGVNRAYIMDHASEPTRGLASMRGVASGMVAVGNVAAGFIAGRLSYDVAMLFFLPVSLGITVAAVSLTDVLERRPLRLRKALASLNPVGKGRLLKKFILLFPLYGAAHGALLSYVIPLYYKEQGFSAGLIGALLSAQSIVSGIVLYTSAHKMRGRLFLLSGAAYLLTFTAIGLSSGPILLMLAPLVGLATGAMTGNQEVVFGRAAGEGTYASDIATLMVGFHVGNAISQAVWGFVIDSWGYLPVFVGSGLLYLTYVLLAYRDL